MRLLRDYFSGFSIIVLLIISVQASKAQQGNISAGGDSLSLAKAVGEVIANHPTIREAMESLNTADARISLAKTGYYPDLGVSATYSNVGPVPVLQFGKETFQLFPANNISASLDLRGSLYDFGKTASKVNLEEENKALANITIEQAKQKLALATTNVFYNLYYLQQAINIKDEQIRTLQEHLDYVQKKLNTGSATQYELLTTKVRLSNVESQKIDLQTTLNSQMAVFNNLLGRPEGTQFDLAANISLPSLPVPDASLLTYALEHRDEVQLSKEKQAVAELNYKVIDRQDNPSLNAFASGGFKNGYIPDLNTIKANYVAGVNLSWPLFDAGRTKNNLLIAQSAIQVNTLETDITKRNIANEVVESRSNLRAAETKVKQFELQYAQAQQALNLAQTSYQSGVITNLDLLDASTNLSESNLLLLKTRIDYAISLYRLEAAIGQRLY